MNPAPPPRVDTPSFVLRPWAESDAPHLRPVLEASDAHLRAWIPWVVDGRLPGQSLEERLRRHGEAFAAGTEWVYGIFAMDATEVLGGCGLYPRIGPDAIEVGYWLSVNHTGRGLATAATEVLTHLAFASPSIDRVEIRCDPANVASARVPARLGYRVAREGFVKDEVSTGTLTIWEMTRAGWK